MTAGNLAGIDETTERDRLLEFLADAGIDAPIVSYPAHTTHKEGQRLRGDLPGAHWSSLVE